MWRGDALDMPSCPMKMDSSRVYSGREVLALCERRGTIVVNRQAIGHSVQPEPEGNDPPLVSAPGLEPGTY